MRVTQSMITRNLVRDLLESRDNMSNLQKTISSGKDIKKASDDPVKFNMANRYRKTIALNEMYLKNITDAQSWVSMTSEIIDDLYEQNLSAKEIALRASDNSLNADVRANLTSEVDAIISEMVSLLNTQYMGKYLFSGTMTKGKAPFQYNNGTLTYQGNEGQIIRRIADGISVTVNISGEVFQEMGLIEHLLDLRNGLQNNDLTLIKNAINGVENSSEKLLAVTTQLGSLKNQLSMTQNRLEVTNTNLSSFISNLEDANIAEVITRYNAEELAYNAALQVTASTFDLSILDFL